MPKNAHFVSENVCSGHFDNFHTCSAHCRIVLRLRHIPPWRLNFEETKEGMNKVTNFSKPPIKITVDFQIISQFEKILTCVKNLKKKKTIRTSNRTVRLVCFMFSASDLLLKPLNHEKTSICGTQTFRSAASYVTSSIHMNRLWIQGRCVTSKVVFFKPFVAWNISFML